VTGEYGVTATGFVVKDFSAIKASMTERIREKYGDDVDLSDTTLAGQLLQVFAYELAAHWQVVESVYYSGYLNTSVNSNLDAIAVVQGIARKPATYAEGTVRFSRSTAGTQDYIIESGTKVSNVDGTLIFETVGEGTLVTGALYVDIPVVCTTAGSEGNVTSGIITTMIDTVSGIESVTNPDPTTEGTDAESDPMLRLRTRVPTSGSKATMVAMEQALAAITGVIEVLVTEDTEHHTVTCYVLGGEDAAINEVIAATRPCGIVASLARPNPVPVAVTTTVMKASTITAVEVSANIRAALESYFGGLEISGSVAYSDIIRAVANTNGVENVNALTATDGTTVLDALGETITVPTNGIATDGTHIITVV